MSLFSIICVIEGGRLEPQTLLMLDTLKRFGGALAEVPTVAFQGRSGQKISAATRTRLAEMGVDYVYRPDLNKAPWFNYTNKIAAVRYAQQAFDTPWRIWLDSDILFLDEPSFADGASLQGTDFHARFEYLSPALLETEDRFTAYWEAICTTCDVKVSQIGFHDLDLPARRMKPYFNSGFFLWRAGTGFAALYERNFYQVLRARIAPAGIGPWFADQVALTPTIAALELEWRMLSPQDHLMLFVNALENPAFLNIVPQANLVHYSKSRTQPYRAVFDGLITTRCPGIEPLLQAADNTDNLGQDTPVARVQKVIRRLRQASYVRRCKVL